MKHIKLFEQFEKEENPWWEEESPFDKISEDEFIGISRIDGNKMYKKIVNGRTYVYKIDPKGNKVDVTILESLYRI